MEFMVGQLEQDIHNGIACKIVQSEVTMGALFRIGLLDFVYLSLELPRPLMCIERCIGECFAEFI
eukprot:7844907-Pyramimonas_sp.AAC.1